MKIEQIILKPITTPEYPDPAEARRFINDEYGVYGYDYVFLEDATWNALCAIAGDKDCTVDDLCAHIDLNFAHGGDFAPAARLYVLRYVAGRIPQSVAYPRNFSFSGNWLTRRASNDRRASDHPCPRRRTRGTHRLMQTHLRSRRCGGQTRPGAMARRTPLEQHRDADRAAGNRDRPHSLRTHN